MAGATFGRLMPFGDTFSSINPFRLAKASISGVGDKKLFLGDPDFEDSTEAFARSPYNGTKSTVGTTVQGYAGPCLVSGHAYVNGVPLQFVRVFLIPQTAPSLIVREAFTDVNGYFIFIDVAYAKYIVLAVDQTATYNAQVYDFVQSYT